MPSDEGPVSICILPLHRCRPHPAQVTLGFFARISKRRVGTGTGEAANTFALRLSCHAVRTARRQRLLASHFRRGRGSRCSTLFSRNSHGALPCYYGRWFLPRCALFAFPARRLRLLQTLNQGLRLAAACLPEAARGLRFLHPHTYRRVLAPDLPANLALRSEAASPVDRILDERVLPHRLRKNNFNTREIRNATNRVAL